MEPPSVKKSQHKSFPQWRPLRDHHSVPAPTLFIILVAPVILARAGSRIRL